MKALLDDAAVARLLAAYIFGVRPAVLARIFGVSVSCAENWCYRVSRSRVTPDSELAMTLEAAIRGDWNDSGKPVEPTGSTLDTSWLYPHTERN